MSRTIRVCTDRIVPPEFLVRAMELAIEETPANVGVIHHRPGMGVAAHSPLRMALVTGKRWKNGRTLRVRFLDGKPEIQAKVKAYAAQWSRHANVKFDFVSDGAAEIRIAFKAGDGSWSAVGTDALLTQWFPVDGPTMNYGWLTPSTPDEEYSRVVIHEFGHALGMIHEHQHPQASIPWDKERAYAYYGGPPNKWSRSDVDHNIFARYGVGETQFSAFDPQSIMLYAVPNDLTVGDYEIGWNTTLSATDKQFVGVAYPFDQGQPVSLTLNAPPVGASIGRHGGEDLYQFSAPTRARYVIETQGPTDVVMSVFGPDSRTQLVGNDDDSGQGRNAKISRVLRPGTYHVLVRHYQPTATGNYQVGVKTG